MVNQSPGFPPPSPGSGHLVQFRATTGRVRLANRVPSLIDSHLCTLSHLWSINPRGSPPESRSRTFNLPGVAALSEDGSSFASARGLKLTVKIQISSDSGDSYFIFCLTYVNSFVKIFE